MDKLDDILGVIADPNAAGQDGPSDEEIEALVAERTEARKAKNFARSDAIRDELLARGIVLEDTPQGVRWKR